MGFATFRLTLLGNGRMQNAHRSIRMANEAALRARADRELEIAHEVQERLFRSKCPLSQV